ncbi:MAG: hypothetical protein INQ03_25850 [Candidatus Heimdallarchaeota archaeon]|nr:hypothetical protein [Candidatus Heimdallarchaeota archaeon]
MSDKYILFSSIGAKMKDNHDPIYFILQEYKVKEVMLFYVPGEKREDRISIQQNIDEIGVFLEKTGVQISSYKCNVEDVQALILELARIILEIYLASPGNLVIDLSAGRRILSHALFQAARMTNTLISSLEDTDVQIYIAIKSRGMDLVSYRLQEVIVPKPKTAEILKIYDPGVRQEELKRKLQWKSQSDVSKALTSLYHLNMIDKKTKQLTSLGSAMQNLLLMISKEHQS